MAKSENIVRSPKKLFVYFIFIFLIKFSVLFYFARIAKCEKNDHGGYFSYFTGDAFSYIGSIENYIQKGTYSFKSGNKTVYAGRMPYYGDVYYIIRQFVKQNVAYDVLVVLQIIVESLSIIAMALLASLLFSSINIFWYVMLTGTLFFNISYWSLYLLPESFSVSSMIFFLFFYFKYKSTRKRIHLGLFSFFLVLFILFKPYFIPLIGFVFLDFLFNNFTFKDVNLFRGFVAVSFSCLFLFIFLTPWIIRNYKLLHQFIPLQETTTAGYSYSKSDFACRRFIQSWGGTAGVYWDKRSAACYFTPKPGRQCEYTFPDFVFTKGYSFKDIESVRNKYIILQNQYNDSLDNEIAKEFDRLTGIFIAEKPIRHYLISPLEITKNFLFNSGSYYLPIRKDFKRFHPWQLCFKALQSFLYYFILIVGLIGLLILTILDHSKIILIVIPFYIISVFCFFIKVNEFRFFNHALPILLIGSAYIIVELFKLVRLK